MNRGRRTGACLLLLALAGMPLAAQVPDPPPGLPLAQDVQRALEDSPRLQVAAEYVASGQARARRLAAGPHEWEVDVLSQQRRDATGSSHLEQEYGLRSGMRWPWKYSLDRRLGTLARETGELAYFDAWHEAGVPEADIATLCRIAGRVDNGTFEAAGFEFSADTWRPGVDGCCHLHIRPGRAP